MRVLYRKNDSGAFRDLECDAVFSDTDGSTEGLRQCICALRRGDILFIEAETDLGNSFEDVVGMFGDLARRGVSIWVERQLRMFDCETSPFLFLGKDLAHDIVDFRNAFTRIRARKGFYKALEEKTRSLPGNFEDLCLQWARKKITINMGAEALGWKPGTFYARARKLLADRLSDAVRRKNDTPA